MIPQVFLGEKNEEVPAGFNAVAIPLEMGLKSNLKWNLERKWAEECVEKGYDLVFEFKLGIFERGMPSEQENMTMQLALEHFKETLYIDFKEHILGCIVYQGKVLSESELECLKWLVAVLPEDLTLFLCLELNEGQYVKLLCEELDPFHLVLKGDFLEKCPYSYPQMGWNQGHSPLGFFAHKMQVLLPEQCVTRGCLVQEGIALESIPAPFRLIAPHALTQCWEGLDVLYVDKKSCSPQTWRKVQGFQAAGGEVVELE